jgi:hypothetical protein
LHSIFFGFFPLVTSSHSPKTGVTGSENHQIGEIKSSLPEGIGREPERLLFCQEEGYSEQQTREKLIETIRSTDR